VRNKKELGQHWLTDRFILGEIADTAEIEQKDTVLEIGPGLGTLTSELLKRAWKVIAVEFDEELAGKLPGQFPGKNLTVSHADFLSYDLDALPPEYVVVANVPYYITSKIVQKLMTAKNKPRIAVLLVQKEVAERIAAVPGGMSILAISAQVYAEARLGVEVPKQFFTPPPKVDSQVIVLRTRSQPLVTPQDEAAFFRLVKAGFSAKRKKLRSSISGGLGISKDEAEELLRAADISPDSRAEDLSIDDWRRLQNAYHEI
jgi:16S rRNA (adenine1518-N6/adenine1519-N6)-dimethyltransferase